jgi:hypothetical protein
MHAGQRLRLVGVDVARTGVGVRTGERRTVQHSAHFKIISINTLAHSQLDGIHFRLGFADHLGL